MDLRFPEAQPTADERAAIDAFLGKPESGWVGGKETARDAHTSASGQAARAQRHRLLPTLHALQSRVGWISPGGLRYISERLTVPPAEAYGVASFYALLPTQHRPARMLHVCDDIACRTNGANEVIAGLEKSIGPAHHERAGNGRPPTASHKDGEKHKAQGWMRSPCLGLCDQAPACLLTSAGKKPVERLVASVTPAAAVKIVKGDDKAATQKRLKLPQAGDPSLRLMKRIDVADPASLPDYHKHGGYAALKKAFQLGPDGIIREVSASGLKGRGGAAFPTGRKWEAVARQAAQPHYLICNADESEPGTFKDRVLMEGDPFALVEAMTIAAYATGCEHGFIYIRGEYPLARERLQHAIDAARSKGYLGANIKGSGFTFDLEIRKGAGAYICGEETAVFNSIEGYRGEPRNKPPFPVESGLFRKPTVINNVETLLNVLEIVNLGGAEYAKIGTKDSTGPRLFCLSGAIEEPGTYEVPFGKTLRQVIELAGGVPKGKKLSSILLGGAAGVFVRPDELDMVLTFEGVQAAKATLGSGVIMLFDDTVDMPDILLRIAAFFRDESCGQCVPCRVGTVRQEEALRRIWGKKQLGSTKDELALLGEIGLAMKDASICGLGQTAYSAIESAVGRLKVFQ
ncbi:MAG TPA: NAD(P)H-dependent oxidoreductase subunit E [Gemmatimonadales bacterium]